MTEKERLIDQFEREIEGQPWHGSSLARILDGVSAAQAAARPHPEAHSIWEILLHMTGWKREVTRRARGAVAAEPEAGDWPAIGDATEARWRAALADHLGAHQELLALLRTLSEAQLAARVPGDAAAFVGAGLSVMATLWGLVQHDVYHSGQVAILKKMVAARG
jgi:uncharacterized damage-inducible protein DinB